MFSMPCIASRSSTAAMSARVASIAVTCAAPSRPIPRMRATSSMVASRGLPPVRVTDTNAGPSGRSASIARMRAVSPSGVLGGKNSNEMSGRPRARSSVIFRQAPGLLLGALLLERLHLLVLAVVVDRVHRHEQAFHAPVAPAAQDAAPLVELAEVLVDARLLGSRIEEEVAEPGHREAQRREAELVRERVPLRQGQRAQRLVSGDERLEPLQLIVLTVEAEGVHGGREVVDELAATRRLEVQDGEDLVALHQQVVVEEVTVNDPLRELRLEVAAQVVDLVVERAHDALEVRGQPPPHLAVRVGDALEGEAVVDALLVALADGVQVGEHAADRFELRGVKAGGIGDVSVDPAIDRETLAARLAVQPSLPVGDG